MRAGRLVDQATMGCEKVEIRPPGEGELLVRTTYASICGSDLHLVYPGFARMNAPGPVGFPGHEGIGEVVESRDPGFSPGDRVLTVPNAAIGMTFAEVQTLPARYCIPLPETDRSELELLMAQQLGTVVYAQRKRWLDPHGRTALVIGQGSAGLFHALLLRRWGAAKVVTTEVAPARLEHSRRTVADVAVDASGGDEAVRQQVLDATGGRGADIVIEAVGTSGTLAQSIELAAPGADLLWFGLPDTREPVPVSFAQFFRKQLHASSAVGAQEEPGLVSFRAALDLIGRGDVDVRPLVSHVLPVEEIGHAFRMAHEPTESGCLKVSVSF